MGANAALEAPGGFTLQSVPDGVLAKHSCEMNTTRGREQ